MKASIAQTLVTFAKSRENAYRQSGKINLAKMTAISKIKSLASYISNTSEQTQIKAIRQVEPEIMLILPHEQSRFSKLRGKILTLIQQSHD